MGRTDVARLREAIGFVDARDGDRFAPLLTVREVIRTGATATIGYFEERLARLDVDRADDLLGTFGLGRARPSAASATARRASASAP